jgi:hypothetical protein
MAAMDGLDRERIDADLLELGVRLRRAVPKATALELDRIKLRARDAHASRGRLTRRSGFMRSRIAVTMMLVFGFLLSGAGASLAVSGISGAGSAGLHQYPAENPGGQQGVLGQNAGNKGGEAAEEAAQPAQQVAVTGGGSQLPFTGLAAVPILLVGAGMVGAGFVLRRAPASKD